MNKLSMMISGLALVFIGSGSAPRSAVQSDPEIKILADQTALLAGDSISWNDLEDFLSAQPGKSKGSGPLIHVAPEMNGRTFHDILVRMGACGYGRTRISTKGMKWSALLLTSDRKEFEKFRTLDAPSLQEMFHGDGMKSHDLTDGGRVIVCKLFTEGGPSIIGELEAKFGDRSEGSVIAMIVGTEIMAETFLTEISLIKSRLGLDPLFILRGNEGAYLVR